MRGIYKITNIINNKCYIGKSEDLAARIRRHYNSLLGGYNRNKHMQAAYEKYGRGSFCIEILEEVGDEENINEREKYYIELYKSYDPEYGYNLTKGGDGGNSYVDCMTEEQKEEHYKKHREIRTGKNNKNYKKHLYTDGVVSKYLSDDEVEEYENKGWHKGASDYFIETMSKIHTGENNSFYGKHHSKETIEKILIGQKKSGYVARGRKVYHKDGQTKHILPEEIKQYEADGWIAGMDPNSVKKMKETKSINKKSHKWSDEQRKKQLKHYIYNGVDFYGRINLIKYLRENGFPLIGKKAVDKIVNNTESKKYPELTGKIQIIEGV